MQVRRFLEPSNGNSILIQQVYFERDASLNLKNERSAITSRAETQRSKSREQYDRTDGSKLDLLPNLYHATPGYYCESMDLASRKISRKKRIPNPYQAIRDKIMDDQIKVDA